jgi:fructose-bisphosphate aldolase, class II
MQMDTVFKSCKCGFFAKQRTPIERIPIYRLSRSLRALQRLVDEMINGPSQRPAWRDNNKHLNILKKAEAEGYGVIAAIAYNIEQILGFVRAAEKAHSPLILQFFPWAITFSDELILRTAADAASKANVPISVHLDHCQDPQLVKRAADMGTFDSIMIDMSHYDKEENLRRTRELVAYCNDRQIATEAEPGRIEGGEDGVADIGELEGVFTTVEEVDEFIDTGVDALAPSFGNVHGEYGSTGPHLDFAR